MFTCPICNLQITQVHQVLILDTPIQVDGLYTTSKRYVPYHSRLEAVHYSEIASRLRIINGKKYVKDRTQLPAIVLRRFNYNKLFKTVDKHGNK